MKEKEKWENGHEDESQTRTLTYWGRKNAGTVIKYEEITDRSELILNEDDGMKENGNY